MAKSLEIDQIKQEVNEEVTPLENMCSIEDIVIEEMKFEVVSIRSIFSIGIIETNKL